MTKTFRTSWVFLPFAALCAALYLRSPELSLLLGIVYASVMSLRLPTRLSARELFPLVMLFLFLFVLSATPPRLFTISLIYTTCALIVFRTMIIILQVIQNSRSDTERSTFTLVGGLAFEFLLSAILVYSTFKPVDGAFLNADHFLQAGVLLILSSVLMPYWIPGVILGLVSFYEPFKIWAIMGFALLAFYESNFSKRSRNTLT
jgi:hypothetical protein